MSFLWVFILNKLLNVNSTDTRNAGPAMETYRGPLVCQTVATTGNRFHMVVDRFVVQQVTVPAIKRFWFGADPVVPADAGCLQLFWCRFSIDLRQSTDHPRIAGVVSYVLGPLRRRLGIVLEYFGNHYEK